VASFDEVFAELQAKVGAVIQVIAADPALSAQVQAAIENAQTEAEIVEQQAADDARANALKQLIVGVRETLAEAAVGDTPA
jgi:TusA-related sulfurtransferase